MTETSIHNNQKKIALINDFSGFGRCSIAVQLPIISALRVQCCPLPTAVFSNHTGFQSFFMRDLTGDMEPYAREWEKLGLSFSGILTGFLSSVEQIDMVKRLVCKLKTPETIVIIDPVMGDHGRRYSTYTDEMCTKMKELVALADIITPNLTEACILTDTRYRQNFHLSELNEMALELTRRGAKKAVITGIEQGSCVCNLCCEGFREPALEKIRRVGQERSGTGDVFSAIIAADAVNGVPLEKSVNHASRFVRDCIQRSEELGIPITDGVAFEELLGSLQRGTRK